MKTDKETIIVLSSVIYKDKSRIVRAFSKEKGIQSYFLRTSSKNNKGLFVGNFQGLSILEIQITENKKGALPNIIEAKANNLFLGIRENVHKNGLAFLIAEFLQKAIKEQETNLDLFAFVETQILLLEKEQQDFANFHLYFICQLAEYLGLKPSPTLPFRFFDMKEGHFVNSIPLHPYFIAEEESKLLNLFFFNPWTQGKELKLNGAKRSQLLEELLRFYEYHLDGFQTPKSLAVLSEVFN